MSQSKPFVCDWADCGKGFARKSDLSRHVRIHTNDRPFVCPEPHCQKAFIQRSALVVHHRVHTGEKPHRCHLCDRAFSDSSSLARHRRIHTGIRPFPCPGPDCQKVFCRKQTLFKHFERYHGDAEYEDPDEQSPRQTPSPVENDVQDEDAKSEKAWIPSVPFAPRMYNEYPQLDSPLTPLSSSSATSSASSPEPEADGGADANRADTEAAPAGSPVSKNEPVLTPTTMSPQLAPADGNATLLPRIKTESVFSDLSYYQPCSAPPGMTHFDNTATTTPASPVYAPGSYTSTFYDNDSSSSEANHLSHPSFNTVRYSLPNILAPSAFEADDHRRYSPPATAPMVSSSFAMQQELVMCGSSDTSVQQDTTLDSYAYDQDAASLSSSTSSHDGSPYSAALYHYHGHATYDDAPMYAYHLPPSAIEGVKPPHYQAFASDAYRGSSHANNSDTMFSLSKAYY